MIVTALAAAMVVTCEVPRGPQRGGWAIEARADGAGVTLRVRPRLAACQAGVPDAPRPREDEWQAGSGYAWSMDLLQSSGDRRYVPVTISWSRDLIPDRGPGLLRGRLMWGVELMPFYVQTAPTSTTGVGVSPLVWRWRFVPRKAGAAFAELAFGGLFTADPVPERTEAANFIAHGAFGIRWRPSQRIGLVTGYRFQHISNGNQLSTNPGVNAHVAWLGVSLLR